MTDTKVELVKGDSPAWLVLESEPGNYLGYVNEGTGEVGTFIFLSEALAAEQAKKINGELIKGVARDFMMDLLMNGSPSILVAPNGQYLEPVAVTEKGCEHGYEPGPLQ